MGAFEFVILSALRAVQLTRGCRPKIDGLHKVTTMAQLEVSAGRVTSWSGPETVLTDAAT